MADMAERWGKLLLLDAVLLFISLAVAMTYQTVTFDLMILVLVNAVWSGWIGMVWLERRISAWRGEDDA